MKGRVIALDRVEGREAAALLVDGRLDDLLIDPKGGLLPGAIYRGRVKRMVKGQGGVFLDLGQGQTGYLRQIRGVSEGSLMTVQVSGHAEPGKATPVTPKITIKGRYAIATPGALGLNLSKAIRDEEERGRIRIAADVDPDTLGDTGLILRSACAGAADDDIADDVAAVLDASALDESDAPGLLRPADGAHFLAWRDWTDTAEVVTEAGSFEHLGVWDAIDAMDQDIPLAGGGFMAVEPTRALVAVDVNTGPDTSPAATLKANLAAAEALPRALRLRGLGGQIVVDFAPSSKKDRKAVETALSRACRACPVETNLIGWTSLGHVELTRKRERLPLSEVL